MGIKLSFLHKHLPNLPENFGEVIDEQCEQCQHDLEVKKKTGVIFFLEKTWAHLIQKPKVVKI